MLRRILRLLGFALVGVVGIVAALALTATFLISRELTPESVSVRLTELLERETTVESVALRLLPFPHVVAENARVADLLTARRFEVGPSLGALARGRLVVASIRVEGPTVEWTLGEDREFAENFADFGGDPLGERASLPNVELDDGRLLVREADGSIRDEIGIERLRLHQEWHERDVRLEMRASLGADGMEGLLHAKGSIGDASRIELTLRAVQASRLARYAPRRWDLRSASGVVDGKMEIVPGADAITQTIDLTLRGGGADVAGVKIAGETQLSGTMIFDGGPFSFTGVTFGTEAIQVYEYSATRLLAEFDWRDAELELRELEFGTVSAGLGAAAALGMPDPGGAPVLLRVEEAGKLSLRGSFGLPGEGATNPRLAVPSLTAVGTALALVHDPGPDESITRIHIERFQVDGYADGQTPTATVEARILGGAPGTITATASVGPIEVGRSLWTHPLRIEARVDGAPASSALPYVPDSWIVPRELGPIDLVADIAGTVGTDLSGEIEVTSRFGTAPGTEGTLVANVSAEPAPEGEDTEITILLDLHDLDARLLEPLPDEWEVDAAAGVLDGSAVLHLHRRSGLDGEFEARMRACRVEAGDLALGGECRASGHVILRRNGLSLPAFELASSTASIQELAGDRFRMRGLWVPPALQIESATANAWDGSVELEGSVLFEKPPRYEVDVTGIHLNLAKILRSDPDSERASDPSRLDGRVRMRGEWRGADVWLEGLEGDGQLDLYGGAVVGMPLRRAIAEALLSVVPGTSLMIGERPLPRTHLERAAVPFAFDEGKVRLEGIDVVTPDYHVKAHGQIRADSSYRFDGSVSLTSDGLRNTLSYVSTSRMTRRALNLPAIPVTARGRFDDEEDASIQVDATAITVNVARGLLGLPLAAGSAATGAVRRGLGALRPGSRKDAGTDDESSN